MLGVTLCLEKSSTLYLSRTTVGGGRVVHLQINVHLMFVAVCGELGFGARSYLL